MCVYYRPIYDTTAHHDGGSWVNDSQLGPNDVIRRLPVGLGMFIYIYINFFILTYVFIIGSSSDDATAEG